MMTELKKINKDLTKSTIVVPIHLNKVVDSTGKDIKWLASVYGQDNDYGIPRNEWFIDQIVDKKLKYINTKKALGG